MPAAVPEATSTEPSEFSVIPPGIEPGLTVTVEVVATPPPSVSLTRMFVTFVPPLADEAPPVSSLASIGLPPPEPVTVIVTVALSQFAGVAVSQIWYGKVYVPGAVPEATSTEPSALSVIPPGIEPGETVTVLVVTTAAPSVSFERMLMSPVPPVAEATPVRSSFAMIVLPTAPVTVIVTVAGSQLAGAAVSQME